MNKIGFGIDLIVKRGNKILLGRLSKKWSTPKGEWGLPGVDINFGETFKQTVERNLEKEIGMKLKNFKIISINSNFWLNNHYINIGVLVEAEGKEELKNKEDWKEWKWFDLNSLPEKLCPPARLTLKSFLENKTSVSN
jgi:ADP-ribose pyrophosphatase YjhB (NUDIX family)